MSIKTKEPYYSKLSSKMLRKETEEAEEWHWVKSTLDIKS